MCGRYTHLFTWAQLHRLMRLTTPLEFPERFNVAPTQNAPVVIEQGGARDAHMLRWGLVPFWAKDLSIGARTINARCETVASTPAFRAAFKERRCLVPVSGFFEWQKNAEGGRKQPWYIHPAGDDPFVVAGLWERWTNPENHESLRTFTILTTRANQLMAPLHDRMPVILSPEHFDTWLHEPDIARVQPLFEPFHPEGMVAHRVSTWVNAPAHDDARCIRPEDAATRPAPGETGGLFG